MEIKQGEGGNPYHEPAGSPTGGEFAPAGTGGGGTSEGPAEAAPTNAPAPAPGKPTARGKPGRKKPRSGGGGVGGGGGGGGGGHVAKPNAPRMPKPSAPKRPRKPSAPKQPRKPSAPRKPRAPKKHKTLAPSIVGSSQQAEVRAVSAIVPHYEEQIIPVAHWRSSMQARTAPGAGAAASRAPQVATAAPVARRGPGEFKSTRMQEHTVEKTQAFAWRELKAVDDNAGIFEGYVAVFNNLDGNGDVIDRGAFTKTLKEAHEVKSRNGSQFLFPLLWQHNDKEPIGGFLEAHEDDNGLFVRGQYDLDIEQGRRAYSGAKKGYLRGLSIGYDTVKSVFQKSARHLLEIRLWEGSPVTFPANTQAGITSVKAQDGGGGEEDKGVSGKTDWPLAPRDRAWDAGAAHGRLLEWAGGKDNLDTGKFGSVHFWSPDGDAKSNVSEYKFPFCDIIDGSPKAVYGAISAGAGRLGSAQGVDQGAIKSRMATYYGRMAKEFNDDSIKVPWSAKTIDDLTRTEMKQLAGLQALTSCASALDCVSDGAEGLVETLAGACGMSVEGPDVGEPHATVAGLLATVDGLKDAVKAVIAAWQEFDQQTDALLDVLGLPDDDTNYVETAVPMYMSQLRSAFELKVGRQLSAGNRDRLAKVAAGLSGHVDEIKGILKDNDATPADEHLQAADYGDVVASGHHNPPGKSLRESGQGGTGPKPGNSTTSSKAEGEPVDETTRLEFEATLFNQSLDLMRLGIGSGAK